MARSASPADVHFTPTSPSWLNAVEGFFTKLTRRHLKHAIFNSITECEAAIHRFIEEHNRQRRYRSGGQLVGIVGTICWIITARNSGNHMLDLTSSCTRIGGQPPDCEAAILNKRLATAATSRRAFATEEHNRQRRYRSLVPDRVACFLPSHMVKKRSSPPGIVGTICWIQLTSSRICPVYP